jgi:hypothetical protein
MDKVWVLSRKTTFGPHRIISVYRNESDAWGACWEYDSLSDWQIFEMFGDYYTFTVQEFDLI